MHIPISYWDLNFNDALRDYSVYPNVNDLFKVADILISDYSASMSDYAILERPVLLLHLRL